MGIYPGAVFAPAMGSPIFGDYLSAEKQPGREAMLFV
jgi:hypothetical protein